MPGEERSRINFLLGVMKFRGILRFFYLNKTWELKKLMKKGKTYSLSVCFGGKFPKLLHLFLRRETLFISNNFKFILSSTNFGYSNGLIRVIYFKGILIFLS